MVVVVVFMELAILTRLQVPLSKGFFEYYPFDDYECVLDIYAYDGRAPATSEIDIEVVVIRAINYGFGFSVEPMPLESDQGYTLLKLQLARTDVFRLYPIFMILSFWFIGISWCIFVSRVVLWNKAKVEAPVVGAAISLLFALPSFRNTAPQSPPIGSSVSLQLFVKYLFSQLIFGGIFQMNAGCTLDVCSFYWAMLFAVLSVIGIIIRYLQVVPAPPP